ncbi:MAG: 3-dehydroquinate synthase [Coriobacteriia bacterium]|nr:3-dehydroquinate synthase [Coriobacteriia bacterium]
MLSKKVAVRLSTAEYQVEIGRDLLGKVGRIVAPLTEGARAVVVTDSQVGPMYAGAVMESLIEVGFETSAITVLAGETSKNWEQAGQVLDQLAEAGLERIDLVVAVGGGVVGDLAGFCAGVFLRGVPFVQVPTTLLAQVDSSVGGKTGVDLAAGKNLAGVFKQPRAVIADIACLQTLPDAEWRSGLAEVAKSAILDSEEFLSWLERNAQALLARDEDVVAEAVRLSVSFKARVVASDELEFGPREALNLGHTLGHAIEKVAGYGVYSHGAAVAEGMRFAAIAIAVAVVLGGTALALASHANTLRSADLPGISTTRPHSTAALPSPEHGGGPTPGLSPDSTSVAPVGDPKNPASATRPTPQLPSGVVRPPSGSVPTPDPERPDEEDDHEVITPDIREDDPSDDEDVHEPESSPDTAPAFEKDSE